jgi:hypothetical protein
MLKYLKLKIIDLFVSERQKVISVIKSQFWKRCVNKLIRINCKKSYIIRVSYIYIYIYIQGVPGGKDLTSGECSLGQTIPI